MIKQKIQDELVKALKAGDRNTVNALRYILAQIKNNEIEKKGELDDNEAANVLRKVAKELKESIDAFEKGGRADLLEESRNQLKIVSAYLPQEINDDELQKEVERIIDQNQELYQKNPKAVIGVAMKELKGKADPARIMKALKDKGI